MTIAETALAIGPTGKGHIVKTLVTGGLGVNGAWVDRELLHQNVDVVVADLNPDFCLLPDLRGHFEFSELDVRDVNRVTALIQAVKPDVIAIWRLIISDFWIDLIFRRVSRRGSRIYSHRIGLDSRCRSPGS
jgi:hypothetical protein